MIWILATRGAVTKLRASPFTETSVEGIHSLVYKAGVEPIAYSGQDQATGPLGAFKRGLHRASGFLFTYHGAAAEELLGMTADIDLIVRYRANAQKRKRTFLDVIFVGDAAITFPSQNNGVSELIGVPFRVQIPEGQTLGQHIFDEAD
jgi:hypothetical protein